MTGTDSACLHTNQSRSYLNHPVQEFMYRDTANVEPEMYDRTINNWSHWDSNEKLKEKFGSCTRKTLSIFTAKDSYT